MQLWRRSQIDSKGVHILVDERQEDGCMLAQGSRELQPVAAAQEHRGLLSRCRREVTREP